MRILRYLGEDGLAHHAAVQPDGTALRIEGSIYGAHTVTRDPAQVRKVLAPVEPTNILGIGLNYRKHAEEGGKGVPERPMLFLKGTNTVQNPGDPIVLPRRNASREVDYECEIAVVIGRAARDVARADALSYVLGYTAANDVSARDWQFKWGGGQFCQAKSFDTFCPLGPVLVTPEDLPNPNNLRIRTLLNGAVMQDWSTADMVFDVPTLIEFLSADKTLLPGTVILTGTPHGVGYARKPPVFLQPGDTVTVELENVGELTNPVV